ncbi:spore coat protein U domain-containing protein [Niveispirillum sp. KHB5.9]|uniref:spore coat protein U domain-containing protein n=1 Tax=Niveispirillum sp. KHB5.9 TaxID=3400269 RepID=UPI003A86596A
MVRMGSFFAGGTLTLCLLLAAPSAWGQTAQGTITLRATVTATCGISLSTGNATLDLTGGTTNIPVATVDERCNAANGYTVSLSSKNGGSLSSGSANIAYTLHYGDSNSAADGSLATSRAVTGTGRQTVLSVSVPGGAQRQAGQYEDTVTIAIAAK